jgi:hypothetical protein
MRLREKIRRRYQIIAVYSFHTNQFMSAVGALASFRRLERVTTSHPLLEFKHGVIAGSDASKV